MKNVAFGTALAMLFTLLLGGCPHYCPECICPVCPVDPDWRPEGCGSDEWEHLPFTLVFADGAAELDQEHEASLAEVVRSMSQRSDVLRFRVEGHSDVCGAEAGDDYALSTRRADAVTASLVSRGMPRDMIEVVSHASTRPRWNEPCESAAPGDLSRANRRVEFSALRCSDPGDADPRP